jgi:hypothetical protein
VKKSEGENASCHTKQGIGMAAVAVIGIMDFYRNLTN